MKKMFSWRLIALTHFSFTLFTSCSPGGIINDPYIVDEGRQRENKYYIPAAPHTPLVSEKNDLNFNILRSSGDEFNGVEVQLAYMPWNNFSLGTSISAGGYKSADIRTIGYSRYELMWGYIKKIDKLWQFETYAGLGTGKINNSHYTGESTIRQTHYFVQPGIAVGNETKTVQFVLASRFAGVNFNVSDTLFSTEREPFSASHLNSLYKQPFHVMWEPSLLFRTGWKNILLTIAYNHSADLTNSTLHRSKDNFSFGVSFRGNTKTK